MLMIALASFHFSHLKCSKSSSREIAMPAAISFARREVIAAKALPQAKCKTPIKEAKEGNQDVSNCTPKTKAQLLQTQVASVAEISCNLRESFELRKKAMALQEQAMKAQTANAKY